MNWFEYQRLYQLCTEIIRLERILEVVKFHSQSLQAPVTAFQEPSKLLILGSLGLLCLQGGSSLQNVIPLVKNLLLTFNFQFIQGKLTLLYSCASIFYFHTKRSFLFLAFIPVMYLQTLMGFSPFSAFICQQKQVRLHQPLHFSKIIGSVVVKAVQCRVFFPLSITCMFLMKQMIMSLYYFHRCHCGSLL